jgi:hypothetical protein
MAKFWTPKNPVPKGAKEEVLFGNKKKGQSRRILRRKKVWRRHI